MADPDCFWFPQLEKCQTDDNQGPSIDDIIADGGDTSGDSGAIGGDGIPGLPDAESQQEQMEEQLSQVTIFPLAGQIAYLTVALLNTAYPLWAQLSYRQNSAEGASYYADWDSLHSTSSLWKTANLVFNYGSLTFWAVALVTQILSFVGIMADINMLIWSYGIFQGLGYLTLAYVVMNFLAIRKPYAADNTSASDDESAVFEDIWNETMTVIGAQAFSFAILYTNYPSWEKSQKMASKPADEAPEEEEVAPEEEGEGEATEEGPAEDQGDVESFMINF